MDNTKRYIITLSEPIRYDSTETTTTIIYCDNVQSSPIISDRLMQYVIDDPVAGLITTLLPIANILGVYPNEDYVDPGSGS